jgi:hypothetical protein
MSLIVSLVKPDGTYSYDLKVEQITHTFTRFAAQSPLYPGDNDTAPPVFMLDLGSCLEQFNITGIVESTGSTPTKSNLEEVCRKWWGYTNANNSGTKTTDLPTLTISDGGFSGGSASYSVALKQADFRRMGGIEDRWEMSLIFLVADQTASS